MKCIIALCTKRRDWHKKPNVMEKTHQISSSSSDWIELWMTATYFLKEQTQVIRAILDITDIDAFFATLMHYKRINLWNLNLLTCSKAFASLREYPRTQYMYASCKFIQITVQSNTLQTCTPAFERRFKWMPSWKPNNQKYNNTLHILLCNYATLTATPGARPSPAVQWI